MVTRRGEVFGGLGPSTPKARDCIVESQFKAIKSFSNAFNLKMLSALSALKGKICTKEPGI